MHRLAKLGVVLCALAISASAADLATLRNGFTVRHERREIVGPTTRLFLSAAPNSYVDVPTDQIVDIERDNSIVEIPAAPASAKIPQPQRSVDELIKEAEAKHQIDRDFLASVIKAESSGNPRAVSPKGAQGLMQLMPQTANKLGVTDSFDPAANVDGGTRYLRQLLELYNNDPVKALAAYNAGPHRVDQYHGVPPYRETRAYVARIIRDYNQRKLQQMKLERSKKTLAAKKTAPTAATKAGASQ